MIIYNVTVKVDLELQEEWRRWMREEHIPAVLATGRFTGYKLCRILHQEEDGATYAVQYFCPDMATMQQYAAREAPRLQAEHRERFQDRYVAIRTLMEVEAEG